MGYNEQSTDRQRFRSFCERYLIARAPFFDKAREEEDAYECMLRAKAIYQRLNAFSVSFEEREEPQQAAQQAAQQGVGGAGPVPSNQFTALQNAVRSGAIDPAVAIKVMQALRAKTP